MCSSKLLVREKDRGGVCVESTGWGWGGGLKRERDRERKHHLVQKWKGSTQWLLQARDTFDPVTCFELRSVSKTCSE